MEPTSKDLLHLEHKNSSSLPLESTLLVCNKKNSISRSNKPVSDNRPTISSVPKSQVLDKVKDFLGVMKEANRRLELGAKDNSEAYDIEVLSGTESGVIEMDLMLGVADLHTPEAVAAAESAIADSHPVISFPACSSETESDDSSDDNDDCEDSDNDGGGNSKERGSPANGKSVLAGEVDSSKKAAGDRRSKKRPKIVELS